MGVPEVGSFCDLDFGPGYQWRLKVVLCATPSIFEWEMIEDGEKVQYADRLKA